MMWSFKRKSKKPSAEPPVAQEHVPRGLTTFGQHEELLKAGFVPVGNPDDDGPIKWKRKGDDA